MNKAGNNKKADLAATTIHGDSLSIIFRLVTFILIFKAFSAIFFLAYHIHLFLF